jgi:hypothetical protein
VRTEPVGSPFTYEALGATPSIRLPKWLTRDEAKAANERSAQSAGGTSDSAVRTDAGKTAAAPAKVIAPAATSTH